jgi:hypothetical protein
MTVSIEEAGTGIKELIDDISTLRQVFAPNELSKSPNVFPCALIIPGPVDYLQAFNGEAGVNFRILVLLAPIDTKVGMDTILPLMEVSGSNSVHAKIIADPTLGGRADTCFVRSCSGIGSIDWGGTNYLSTEFSVDVCL